MKKLEQILDVLRKEVKGINTDITEDGTGYLLWGQNFASEVSVYEMSGYHIEDGTINLVVDEPFKEKLYFVLDASRTAEDIVSFIKDCLINGYTEED